MSARTNRSCQCNVRGPTGLQSGFQCSAFESEGFFPCGQTLRDAPKGNQAIVATISCLLHRRTPFAIARLVVSIVVDTIDAVPWRGFIPHVVVKCFKRKPAITYRNASPAIVWIRFTTLVVAAIEHVLPRPIFCGCDLPMAKMPATPASPIATSKRTARHRLFFSALASTEPEGLSAVCNRVLAKDLPQSKCLPSKVFETRATLDRITGVHQNVLHNRIVMVNWPWRERDLSLGPLHYTASKWEVQSHAA